MNKYICVGRLGFDPSPISGGCSIKIAVDTYDGKQTKPVWLKVLVFGPSSKNTLEHKVKGDRVLIEGRIDVSSGEQLVIVTDNVQFL